MEYLSALHGELLADHKGNVPVKQIVLCLPCSSKECARVCVCSKECMRACTYVCAE